MKKVYWLIIILAIVVLGVIFIVLRGQEDNWIKDSRGVWVKHGNPSSTPAEVSEQQSLIVQAQQMYQKAKILGQDFSSGPCLGKVADDWVVDTVHDPRQPVDDQLANQCAEYHEGKAHHYIELDINGNVFHVQ